MARKLKSDKVLFFATLLLVFASIVMVYSASAVMAMERFHRPYLFLIKQSMWAALGLAGLAIVMIGERTLRFDDVAVAREALVRRRTRLQVG